MSAQFFSKLSQNFIELLKDGEYYDITIEVGEGTNVKHFRAHTNILCYRSPYLRNTLASNKKNNDNVQAHVKLPNIQPDTFQIILEYIYGGIFSLGEENASDIVKALAVASAADELRLQELADYLQKYFIEKKTEWMIQHFDVLYRTSFKSNNLLELQQFCTELMAKSPEKLFKSIDFTLLPEKSLISLIKNDDLQMKEVEVWDYVLQWGLAQNPTLNSSPNTWSDNDFKAMGNTLQNCIPLIRFFSISSNEFSQRIRPYKKLFKPQLYDELSNSYVDTDSKPNINILLPRNIKADGIINSNIVNLNSISIISRWIDRLDVNANSKFTHLRELYLPYKFELLLRGSRDGFTPKKFHELCDNKPNTLTLIKVKGTEEILGGYNPLIWKSTTGYGQTKYSFLFSFKNKDELKNSTLSRVRNKDKALFFDSNCGPSFGFTDLVLSVAYNYFKETGSAGYDNSTCKQADYERKIRGEDKFSMEDYEVFQVLKS